MLYSYICYIKFIKFIAIVYIHVECVMENESAEIRVINRLIRQEQKKHDFYKTWLYKTGRVVDKDCSYHPWNEY